MQWCIEVKKLKLTLSEINKIAHRKLFSFEEEVDVSEIETMNNDIRKIDPVRIQEECSVNGDEYTFTLTMSGAMILLCARTLEDVTYTFEVNTVEIFSSSEFYGEEEEEQEIHPVVGEVIDLKPCIVENILLAVPFRVFSDQKDQDHTKFRGEGWQLTLEEELDEAKANQDQDRAIDPRLKKLAALLDKDQDE